MRSKESPFFGSKVIKRFQVSTDEGMLRVQAWYMVCKSISIQRLVIFVSIQYKNWDRLRIDTTWVCAKHMGLVRPELAHGLL